MREPLSVLLLTLASACGGTRLVGLPEACPTGCYAASGECVPGISETACGVGGGACGECALSEACVEQACRPLPFVELERLTWGPRFESLGSKPLPADVTRLTTLQPEEDARAAAQPVVYGLRAASRDVAALGDWASFGATLTRVASAVAPGDEAAPAVTFNDVFAGNRRLLLTGYAVGGAHRLFLHSTDPAQRPVGRTSEAVAGPFSAAPVGDFYFLSAPGLMSATGHGVYGFLDGPSLNSARRIAASPSPATAGPGLMALAQANVGLFGVFDTVSQRHEVHACTLDAYMGAYIAAANQPAPLGLHTCPVVYRGGAEAVALARVAGGFAVLERGAEAQRLLYVPLEVTGAGANQTVRAGEHEVLATAPNAAFIESLTDYGDDLLLVVRRSLGRDVERAHRR